MQEGKGVFLPSCSSVFFFPSSTCALSTTPTTPTTTKRTDFHMVYVNYWVNHPHTHTQVISLLFSQKGVQVITSTRNSSTFTVQCENVAESLKLRHASFHTQTHTHAHFGYGGGGGHLTFTHSTLPHSHRGVNNRFSSSTSSTDGGQAGV